MCVQIFIYIQFLFLFDFRYIVVVLLGVVVVPHVKKVPYFSSIEFFYFYEIYCLPWCESVRVCVCEPQRFCWLHLQLRVVTFVGVFVAPCHHDDDDDIVDPLTQARTLPQISRDFWMTWANGFQLHFYHMCVCVYGTSRNSSGIAVCMSMYHIANDHTASLSFRDSKPKSMATARARATMYYANILFVCPWRACVYVCVHGVRVWESDAAFCGSK